jgi:hypothetical protein
MTIYSRFSHEKWWFSIAMLVYQRVEQRMETWVFTLKYTGFPDVTPPWTKNYGKVMVSSFQVQMDIGISG